MRIFLHLLLVSFGTCLNYPLLWRSKGWKDSLSGSSVTYTTDAKSGMSVNILGSELKDWKTYSIPDDETVISRSESTFSYIGNPFYAYFCQKYKQINESIYVYVLMSKKLNVEQNQRRVFIQNQATAVSTCDVCDNDDTVTDADMHIMRSDGGDTNVNLTGLCSVKGCNKCVNSSCSDTNIECTSTANFESTADNILANSFLIVLASAIVLSTLLFH